MERFCSKSHNQSETLLQRDRRNPNAVDRPLHGMLSHLCRGLINSSEKTLGGELALGYPGVSATGAVRHTFARANRCKPRRRAAGVAPEQFGGTQWLAAVCTFAGHLTIPES